MKQKTRVVKFRVNEEQFASLERKAGKFATRTAAILHAIETMDDTTRREKLIALAEMTALYKQYQQRLSWMGGNFNQVVKRANELAIGQELSVPFFEHVLYPQIKSLQALLEQIKDDLLGITQRLCK